MTQARFCSSTTKPTTTTADPGATGTTLTVADSTVFASLDGSFPYTLAINWGQSDQELVNVTARPSGTTLTIQRGQDGTAGVSHPIGATVTHDVSARDFNEAGAHRGSSTGVHGITGAVVGTTDTQVLSHKSTSDAFNVGGALTVTGASTLTGLTTSYVTKTAAYTLTASDSVVGVNASSAAVTVTLPTAVGVAGLMYTIKKVDTSVNTVTIATTSGQTIDGSTSLVLRTPYLTVQVVSDGTRWQTTNITSTDPTHPMTLQNSWANTGTNQAAAYQAIGMDQVAVAGYINGGTITNNTTIATLPVGYRMLTYTNSASQPIYVFGASSITLMPVMWLDNAGNLKIYNLPTGTTQIQFNITFRTNS